MSHRAYAVTTGIVFLLIAGGHLFRLEFGWKISTFPVTASSSTGRCNTF
jgi:hypothetical protein